MSAGSSKLNPVSVQRQQTSRASSKREARAVARTANQLQMVRGSVFIF